MTNFKEKVRRILFPTYDETMRLYQAAETEGEKRLEEYGYHVGDTVYLDGKLEGIIWSASIDPAALQFGMPFVSLHITVKFDARKFEEYTGREYPTAVTVEVPCTLNDITRERHDDD